MPYKMELIILDEEDDADTAIVVKHFNFDERVDPDVSWFMKTAGFGWQDPSGWPDLSGFPDLFEFPGFLHSDTRSFCMLIALHSSWIKK